MSAAIERDPNTVYMGDSPEWYARVYRRRNPVDDGYIRDSRNGRWGVNIALNPKYCGDGICRLSGGGALQLQQIIERVSRGYE